MTFHTVKPDTPSSRTPEEIAGYLLWYCGGRACALTYARFSGREDVRAVLVARHETPYTPPSAAAHRAPEAGTGDPDHVA